MGDETWLRDWLGVCVVVIPGVTDVDFVPVSDGVIDGVAFCERECVCVVEPVPVCVAVPEPA